MSARFWLFSMVSAGAALAGGLGLGFYAVTPPRTALEAYDQSDLTVAQVEEAALNPTLMSGPEEVRCTGCGPTLAQRQMAADFASWDGYGDPIVEDYEAGQPDPPEDLLSSVEDAPPRLPAQVERFASGEDVAPYPMKIAQAVPAAPDRVQPVITVP